MPAITRTVVALARRHHLSTWTFWYWCHKLAREDASAVPTGAPAFVPVDVTQPASAPVIEVVLRNGERLQVGADASLALVPAVLTTLRC